MMLLMCGHSFLTHGDQVRVVSIVTDGHGLVRGESWYRLRHHQQSGHRQNAMMRLMRLLLSLMTSLFPFPQRPVVIALRVHVVFDNVGHAVEAGEALGLRLC
jgi:hypothetical protein